MSFEERKLDARQARIDEWSVARALVSGKVFAKTDGLCFYCGVDAANDFTIDHFIPISKGGTDEIGNLVPCCRRCNCSKRDQTIDEWRRSRRIKIAREEMGMPVLSSAAVEWLRDRGFDVLDGVRQVTFWFEAEASRAFTRIRSEEGE